MTRSVTRARAAARPALTGIGIMAAVLMSTGTAQAAFVDATLTLDTPRNNTIVASITNVDLYNGASCSIRGNGPTTFEFLNIGVAPRNTTTVTIADVPAGNYTISWGCNSWGYERHLVTVSGTATPPAQPHIVPNGIIPSSPGGTGSLGSLGF
ncbi:hypothetical protein [Prescottella agglutinans]|uniref:Spore coat protein U domain-containing protein n=1 Tax=Prescottella agglutinans TaxID=1644129 RepID=A0ABT6MKQ8_9NOCA|nr:hypothetical protein [Prescottella agglutinans]MDH6284903.1 hypothetical protein [Prescottella agglutinans]